MKYQATVFPSGQVVEVDTNNFFRKDNVIQKMDSYLQGKGIDYETLMQLCFYVEYGIYMDDMEIVECVNDRIKRFFEDIFHKSDS